MPEITELRTSNTSSSAISEDSLSSSDEAFSRVEKKIPDIKSKMKSKPIANRKILHDDKRKSVREILGELDLQKQIVCHIGNIIELIEKGKNLDDLEVFYHDSDNNIQYRIIPPDDNILNDINKYNELRAKLLDKLKLVQEKNKNNQLTQLIKEKTEKTFSENSTLKDFDPSVYKSTISINNLINFGNANYSDSDKGFTIKSTNESEVSENGDIDFPIDHERHKQRTEYQEFDSDQEFSYSKYHYPHINTEETEKNIKLNEALSGNIFTLSSSVDLFDFLPTIDSEEKQTGVILASNIKTKDRTNELKLKVQQEMLSDQAQAVLEKKGVANMHTSQIFSQYTLLRDKQSRYIVFVGETSDDQNNQSIIYVDPPKYEDYQNQEDWKGAMEDFYKDLVNLINSFNNVCQHSKSFITSINVPLLVSDDVPSELTKWVAESMIKSFKEKFNDNCEVSTVNLIQLPNNQLFSDILSSHL